MEKGIRFLRDLGLRVRHIPPPHPARDIAPISLAATDQYRIQELHRLWADEEVKALISARGGYGCLRIINQLDLDLIRANPKWLIGFSDLTVLLNGITAQTGMITLHGPMACTFDHTERPFLAQFKEILAGNFPACPATPEVEILRGGMGQGLLMGGNLTTLTHLVGTPWQPPLEGNILFLEDTGEAPYKLDRMLTHLAACGLLDNLAGLILGVFDPGHDDRLEILRLNEQVWNRALELTESSSYPIWGGFPVGHQRKNLPMPVGMEAVLDVDGTLCLLPAS